MHIVNSYAHGELSHAYDEYSMQIVNKLGMHIVNTGIHVENKVSHIVTKPCIQ